MKRLTTVSRLSGAVMLAVLMTAATTALVRADGATINACVNRSSGEIKITNGVTCAGSSVLLQWNQTGTAGPAGAAGPAGPAGATGPAGPPGVANAYYVTAGMYPDTSVSRAFCPPGTKVTGGGGISITGIGMQQSFPISDTSGVVAFGSTAIGWQVAAPDFSDVQAFVVCVGP
jgi:hypothetical protein